MLRLAINGYGRIGRSVLRALYESPLRSELQVVAVNELADARTVLHLTRYDSTHGRFNGTLAGDETRLWVNGDPVTDGYVIDRWTNRRHDSRDLMAWDKGQR